MPLNVELVAVNFAVFVPVSPPIFRCPSIVPVTVV